MRNVWICEKKVSDLREKALKKYGELKPNIRLPVIFIFYSKIRLNEEYFEGLNRPNIRLNIGKHFPIISKYFH